MTGVGEGVNLDLVVLMGGKGKRNKFWNREEEDIQIKERGEKFFV